MAKKVKAAKPLLLGALKRIIPACKDENGHAHVRFSVSENGNLELSGCLREKGGTQWGAIEEIPEANLLKPGGPGLLAGDFGVVNLSSGPLDFTTDAMLLLPALKKAKGDPTIFFRGRDMIIEFQWGPSYRFFIGPELPEPVLAGK